MNNLEILNKVENLDLYLHVIKQIPVSSYWKDKNGKYLGCNDFVLEMSNTNQIIGKSDFEMPWKEYAAELRRIDEMVMRTDVPIELEETPLLANGKQAIMLTRKSRLKDEQGNIIGIIGISIDITERKVFTNRDNRVCIGKFPDLSAYPFSKRQKECLFLPVRGYTYAEMAQRLNIQTSTVQTHINHIKDKLNLRKRAQIVELMMDRGFLPLIKGSFLDL